MHLARTHRRPMALAVPLVLVLAAACGGVGATGIRGQAGLPETTTTTTTVVSDLYPLTGRPAVNAANAARPAVSVKIDNSSAARPQAGLDQADLIYEEFTEGITRFVVVFHSSDAATVGPVRSVRPGDADIVQPLGGPLVFSGGAPAVLGVVRAAGLTQITENDTDTLRRRSGRRAPHNLYTSTEAMFRKAGPGSPPPDFAPFLNEGEASAAAGATPVTSLAVAAAPGVSAAYAWDAGSTAWKRSTDGRPHMLEGDVQISPANVIVQYAPYLQFPADRNVRFPEVVGSGDALVFVGGMQVAATWTKSSPTAVTAFTDTAGAPIPLAPGQTWVHLQAPGSAVTSS